MKTATRISRPSKSGTRDRAHCPWTDVRFSCASRHADNPPSGQQKSIATKCERYVTKRRFSLFRAIVPPSTHGSVFKSNNNRWELKRLDCPTNVNAYLRQSPCKPWPATVRVYQHANNNSSPQRPYTYCCTQY